MKSVNQKSNEKMASEELRNILITRRDVIIRTANSELINLFWQIGTQLKQTKEAFKETKEKVDILITSSILGKQYSNFFSATQLHKMELFAYLFPNLEEVRALSYFFSWKHFLLFLKIKDSKTRNYFVKLSIQNNLSIKELESKINESRGKSSSLINNASLDLTFKKTIDTKEILNYLVQTAKARSPNRRNIESIFEEPFFSIYCSLTETKSNSSRNFRYVSAKNLNKPTALFIEKNFERIDNFSQQQRLLINANLNLLLWEISKYINEVPWDKTYKKSKQIENYGLILSKKIFDELFTRNELFEIGKFARVVPDLAIATWIAHILSWKHIQILLSLENLETIIYYSALAAKNNMSVHALKKLIQTNIFDVRSYKNSIDSQLINAFQNPIAKTDITKTNHGIETITLIDYEFKNMSTITSTINTCKNPLFIKVVKFNPREIG